MAKICIAGNVACQSVTQIAPAADSSSASVCSMPAHSASTVRVCSPSRGTGPFTPPDGRTVRSIAPGYSMQPEVAVVDLSDEAARPQLRVADQVGGVLHRRGGDAGALQQVRGLVRRAGRRPLGRARSAPRRSPARRARPAGSARRAPRTTAPSRPGRRRRRRASRSAPAQATTALNTESGHDVVPPLVRPSRWPAGRRGSASSRWRRPRPARDRGARPTPVVAVWRQRGEHAERTVVAGDVVEVVAVGVTPRRAQADVVADVRGVGRVPGAPAGLSVAGDRQHRQPRVRPRAARRSRSRTGRARPDGSSRRPRRPWPPGDGSPRRRRARPAPPRRCARCAPARRTAQWSAHPTVRTPRDGRRSSCCATPPAAVRLDLDDVHAQFGEEHRRGVAGDERAEGEHAEVRKTTVRQDRPPANGRARRRVRRARRRTRSLVSRAGRDGDELGVRGSRHRCGSASRAPSLVPRSRMGQRAERVALVACAGPRGTARACSTPSTADRSPARRRSARSRWRTRSSAATVSPSTSWQLDARRAVAASTSSVSSGGEPIVLTNASQCPGVLTAMSIDPVGHVPRPARRRGEVAPGAASPGRPRRSGG